VNPKDRQKAPRAAQSSLSDTLLTQKRKPKKASHKRQASGLSSTEVTAVVTAGVLVDMALSGTSGLDPLSRSLGHGHYVPDNDDT
jgi:hypothetical protein